jgi:hypothetical protein
MLFYAKVLSWYHFFLADLLIDHANGEEIVSASQ